MENPIGGPAPTGSPTSDIPRTSLSDLLNASLRGEVGPVTVEYRCDGPAMVYDEFGHIGYVDSEGFRRPRPRRAEAGRLLPDVWEAAVSLVDKLFFAAVLVVALVVIVVGLIWPPR